MREGEEIRLAIHSPEGRGGLLESRAAESLQRSETVCLATAQIHHSNTCALLYGTGGLKDTRKESCTIITRHWQ
jgi:hypothetical protein